ncbi:rhodanese-like domain-containing protein [Actinoalloteichus hymeniacidonis]|uniref:Rhodanese-related sulfurtransferase n=1 Tax=Actinoalloteichus hymeniacidonis TaxID=340345 RepID=A0AAC9HMS7_9PSEU|nr:rhodanese-like domain-containing protein [Actinoalloteichus hymeniacidonis]AOS62138.1 Rhodanese-related sulfurtransferase [Actinoalloteichus hymeniacidonis]MBB5909840.1 rhodanese-related sulfurtransferase [Actinoalloteichus hymeniacidonis]
MSIDERLAKARAGLRRHEPKEAAELHRQGALLIDIRPRDDRAADGEIPEAIPVERIVLEWRLDPAGSHRLPQVDADRPVVVFCNEGYASSLAARDLGELGLRRVGDLVGGFRAWRAAGLPVVPGGGPAIP